MSTKRVQIRCSAEASEGLTVLSRIQVTREWRTIEVSAEELTQLSADPSLEVRPLTLRLG